MVIRPEEPADFDVIDEIVKGAFDGRVEEVQLVRAVRATEHYVPELTLVAEDGDVVGHIMLSYVHLNQERVLSLAPLAVRPDHQCKGIGDALSREALRLADEMNEPLVVVLGHPNYYPRFGFEPSRKHGIEPHVPEIPDEVFMVARLSAYDPELRGRITYPPAFDETS
ncbi:MAG: N-acetyltransferase [Actinomycetota bacterium]